MRTHTATIATGQSLSDPIDITGGALLRLVMPAAWDAADLTFQVSHDGTTFQNLYRTDGSTETEVKLKTSAGRAYQLSPLDFAGLLWIKVRSGTGALPVNQTAPRSIQIVAG